MNISVSNIAWNKEENDDALDILKQNEINAIDIAPTLIFDSINNLTKESIQAEYEKYKNLGFKIVAMQSLLYGMPPYSIFDGDKERKHIFQYLEKNFFIAKGLNIKNLVFGCPKNRYIKDKNKNNTKIAIDFFQRLCNLTTKFGLNICLEANPQEYGCNFITNTFEAVDFIEKVNRKNFLLNLDTSTIILNNNNFKEVFDYSHKYIKHVHISSPYIKEISKIAHKDISNLLRLHNYQEYVSLEMKPNSNGYNLKNLEKNIKIFKKHYNNV